MGLYSSFAEPSSAMSHGRSEHSSQASNVDRAITIDPSEIELEKDANGNFVLLGVGTYGRVSQISARSMSSRCFFQVVCLMFLRSLSKMQKSQSHWVTLSSGNCQSLFDMSLQ